MTWLRLAGGGNCCVRLRGAGGGPGDSFLRTAGLSERAVAEGDEERLSAQSFPNRGARGQAVIKGHIGYAATSPGWQEKLKKKNVFWFVFVCGDRRSRCCAAQASRQQPRECWDLMACASAAAGGIHLAEVPSRFRGPACSSRGCSPERRGRAGERANTHRSSSVSLWG